MKERLYAFKAPDREVYTRGEGHFSLDTLADVAEKAFEEFANPSTESLEHQDPLPYSFR